VASGLSASKGAARRTIAEGGVSVNNTRIESDEWVRSLPTFSTASGWFCAGASGISQVWSALDDWYDRTAVSENVV